MIERNLKEEDWTDRGKNNIKANEKEEIIKLPKLL